jgi:dipeptidyl-peptidase-4
VRQGGVPERVKTDESASRWQTAKMSRDGSTLAVTTADDHSPRETLVMRADASSSIPLPSVALEPPAFGTTIEFRKVGEGDGFWSSIVRPSGFKKGSRYPVILHAYGGPTVLFVHHGYVPLDNWFAEQGFLVVRADGRGTPRRGHNWQAAIRGNFSQVILDDQIRALRSLAHEVPELDRQRVGIVGWSFGGYLSALAVMKRPDIFKAAVAGAPVVDWMDYDTHYTERYLGLPEENRGGYEASSLLPYAQKLERPLLIIHGTADDNVFFFNSLKLSDALFRAGRPHVLLPLNGSTHLVREPLAIQRLWERVIQHFRQNL